jgi:prepilin-type N-terminal cleavage/methylation domain-containing protein
MIFSSRKFWKPDRASKNKRDHRYALNTSWVRGFKRLIIRMFAIGDRMASRVRGFTLIELLVAMLIATIIISTMLAFTVNIMETDRREQAKVESQGEVQASLDYISDDMQEAVYIYNSDGLERTSLQTPRGISDQLPVFANSTPVLGFWKRIYYAPTADVNVGGGISKRVGCLEYGTSTTNTSAGTLSCTDDNGATDPPNATHPAKGAGRYTYSLVVYYLINDNSNGTNPAWSSAARIGRWELKDGIRSTCQLNPITACTEPKPISQTTVNTSTGAYVNYWVSPDPGFKLFDANGTDVATVMNLWTKTGIAYTNTLTTLLDLVDDTPFVAGQDNGTATNPPFTIAIGPNTTVSGNTTNANCADPMIGVGGTSAQASQRIPATFTVGQPSSFYVCVNSTQTAARIYLRGNAFARLRPNQTQTQRPITAQNNSFISTGSVRAYGRGKLFFQ